MPHHEHLHHPGNHLVSGGDSSKGVVSEPQWSSNPPPVATALNRHGLKPVTPAAGTDGMAQGHWNECPPSSLDRSSSLRPWARTEHDIE